MERILVLLWHSVCSDFNDTSSETVNYKPKLIPLNNSEV